VGRAYKVRKPEGPEWVTSGGARVAPRAYGLPRIADEFLHAEVGSFVPNSEVVRLARSNSEEHLAGQLMPGILSQLRARRSALAQQRLHRRPRSPVGSLVVQDPTLRNIGTGEGERMFGMPIGMQLPISAEGREF
jgi:hypothetical protein